VIRTILAVGLVALAAAGEAAACACINAPLEERLDAADAAVVGRLVSEQTRDLRGAQQRLITVEVTQRVKGDLGETIVVRSPSGSDCDLPRAEGQRIGLLLERAPDGGWLGNLCGVVGAGELVAEGGEPRGGVIKVVLGVLILGLVLSWALRRRARGTRPHIPGAPEP
jgi:hypothetical protein